MKRVPEVTPKVMQLFEEAGKESAADRHRHAIMKLDAAMQLAREAGITSVSLFLAQADNLAAISEHQAAFEVICEAAIIDPVNPLVGDRFTTLAQQVRDLVVAAVGTDDNEDVPVLYALLSKVGETDSSSHLALARYHAAKGELAAAMKLVEAVNRLQPALVDAWRLRLELAIKSDDVEGAKKFAARAEEAKTQVTTPWLKA